MCCAIKLMAMRESPDSIDDYMRMSERTARESLYLLARGIVETFSEKYLRKPSLHDMQQLYATHEERYGFPGVAGSNNDVNVLDQSPIFDDLLSGKTSDAHFTVNGNEYKFGYYLTDGIYLPYSTFVKAFQHPIDPRDKYFKRRQEGACKDVERVAPGSFLKKRRKERPKEKVKSKDLGPNPEFIEVQVGSILFL
ncbi:uncharacterized protein LOC111882828 [Lactuca sativa]|uniref:uncharacterized protein LOC111882828 n=1 Tax=Lactuca sativa TaxID=4236 RepID=UPI0022AEE715|nr:uncharacterized protein LOC111882828 [Lactuca sativa]